MSVRGIHTDVTDMREKIFTEVARLAYEGGDYSRLEELPYKIASRRRSPTMALSVNTLSRKLANSPGTILYGSSSKRE